MSIRIAINGFGRIGRCITRNVVDREDVELVAINDLADNEQLAYLFERDTVHGTYPGEVESDEETISIDGESIPSFSVADPAELPWDELEVDFALECTGQFRRREDAVGHLEAGAEYGLISAPGKGGIDYSVVMGVNEEGIAPDSMDLIDVASCTTNCLAPVAKVLHDEFEIERGLMTTVHSYTGSQALLDAPNPKIRRGRAAAENMVPTTTGAAVAVTEVLPELEGRLDGMAVRVPTPDGSLIDLVATLGSDASVDAVNGALREAANGELEGILGYTDEPIVSSDILGDPRSSVVDGDSTMMTGERTVKVISWYDNEWGFANRMLDVVEYIDEQT
ncbi:MAG: type I glyceraldehyde-3-phosphate dehydrogenase [Bradymonadaceae bacterium]